MSPKLVRVQTQNRGFLLFKSEVGPGSDTEPQFLAFSVRSDPQIYDYDRPNNYQDGVLSKIY
ncbi:hypothetical protein [Cytobacillus firmus]|uniref:hypothetical protein n=1 Tax=Cytobacillus firmus TaxID=1399 RepID=UPI0030034D49